MIKVTKVADGVVWISGKHPYQLLELFSIDSSSSSQIGVLMEADGTEAKLFVQDQTVEIAPGSAVHPAEMTLSTVFGDDLLGSVVNAMGQNLDGRSRLKSARSVAVTAAPVPLMGRKPVSVPLLTGTLALDWLVPIARGQRELIIGDAGTGKTQLALNAIIAQASSGVKCVYVAVGQKTTDLLSVVDRLRGAKAFAHTVVVAAGASSSALERYAAPLAGMRFAELWAAKGHDVLIVFDDLSKHAEAYREMSLLLQRPPGREAYPGDIFSLHASLLERAGAFGKAFGNGTITAVPIAQTVEGEIASYIPTNLISITDGQIYLSKELFVQGVRPAVDLGLSVSRIGANAQPPLIRELSSALKVDFSLYNDQKSFLRMADGGNAVVSSRLTEVAVLPELLLQGSDDLAGLAVSAVLLSLYRAGLLHGQKNLGGAVAAIKDVVKNSKWFAKIINDRNVNALSSDQLALLAGTVFAPMLLEGRTSSPADARTWEQVPSDPRLYEEQFALKAA